MLTIVTENPIQLTIVKAVPLTETGAFCATSVENKGESAITTIPQNNKKLIKIGVEAYVNSKGELKQQTQERVKKVAAVCLVPFC